MNSMSGKGLQQLTMRYGMKMITSTSGMINRPMCGMMSEKYRKYEVPIKDVYGNYVGNGEFIKRLLRMQGWWTIKFN